MGLEIIVENTNYAQYTIDKDFNFNCSFTLYDSATMTRLLKDDPQMLPEYNTDAERDYVYSRKLMNSAIQQGVIQGESIPKIAHRVAEKLGSNNQNLMTNFARTAMTCAQNAGRIEAMHNAQGMGIKVKKLWIATLDRRTRDSHAELDGQAGIQELAGDCTMLYYFLDEAQEGGKAFLEKRKPDFKKYPKLP